MLNSVMDFFQECLLNESNFKNCVEDEESVKMSMAILMWSIIIADRIISENEIRELYAFFQNEFHMSDKEIDRLINDMHIASHDIVLHAEHISRVIAQNQSAKLNFMMHLTSIMRCDQINDSECRIFEKIRDQFI